VSEIGLVLGGGGITGAAYHFGALLALRMATGWEPNEASVIVGTSSGAFVGAMVRGGALGIGSMIGEGESREAVARWLQERMYPRARPGGVGRWLTKGILPALRRPNINIVLGSPGMYRTDGLEGWVEERLGDLSRGWPERPTVIVAYDLERRARTAFGTDAAPDVPLKRAVAASSAVPVVYEPVEIDGRWYVDGGVASGTNADLVLGSPRPLDLVIVIAPLAATDPRRGHRFYEDMFDRMGRSALASEIERIETQWPAADVLILRPDERVLQVARPNPMSTGAAVPSFLATLRTMRDDLAEPTTWRILRRHLDTDRANA